MMSYGSEKPPNIHMSPAVQNTNQALQRLAASLKRCVSSRSINFIDETRIDALNKGFPVAESRECL